MKIMMIICMIYLVVVTHAFLELTGDDDHPTEWTISGSWNLNNMQENSAEHTFGLGTSDDSDYSGTNCDFLVGVFTAAGSFGCVIHGIGRDEVKYCDTYPDTPVYAFVHAGRRFGTFVAVEDNCTDGLKIHRVYMKNQSGNYNWSFENRWLDSDGDTPGKFSMWQIDSDADTGYFLEQSWAYIPPSYEWHTEGSLDCPTDCNYAGGAVDRTVVCRRTRPSMHDYISWDGSECAGLTRPTASKVCPAGSCQWVQEYTDWNCLGSGSSLANKVTTGVTSAAQCQADCFEYSYAGWWNHSSKQKCKCFHVCSGGGATSGGVYTNIVYEQVAARRRKN